MRHRRPDHGFTLVEILIAIVLVGILTAVVVVGVGSLTSKGSASACSASLDASRAATAVHLAGTGAYPTSFTQMTSAAPPTLSLPSGVTVDASGTTASGNGWVLSLLATTAGAPPTFVCSTDVPSGWTMGPNGHLYRVITTPANWATAASAAAAITVNGAPGSLATITSTAENAFVYGLATADLWLGGSDLTTEGDWRWTAGPEVGTAFWSGNWTGSAVGGAFTKWNPNEPNNNAEQDCLRRVSGSANWDDMYCSTSYWYVVEVGS